ncbi:MAG: class I SAM-dependent methyltransferase [Bryobacteraceae bacterium]
MAYKRWMVLTVLASVLGTPLLAQEESYPDQYERIYVPTPQEVVDEMLQFAKVGPNDVLYDLGCGDGRIVISAARLGARGVGIDITPERIKESDENAKAAGVTDRVTFINSDFFEIDVSPATVVALYLLPVTMDKLLPKLRKELKPGTRIVSHNYQFSEWKPDKELQLDGRILYLWTVPERDSGSNSSKKN